MDNLNQLVIAKTVIRWTVISGTSKIVRDIIKNNVTVETTADKVKVAAGTFAIGGLVAEKISAHTDQKVDDCIEQYHELKKFIQEINSEEK